MIPFLHMKFNFLHYENQLPRTTPRCKHLCRVIFSFTFPSFVTKFSKTQSICLWMGVIIFLFIIHSKLNDDCNICECSSMNIIQLKWFIVFSCTFSPNTSSQWDFLSVNVHHQLNLPLDRSDSCLINSITCFSTKDS
jgi:hypothetical protein